MDKKEVIKYCLSLPDTYEDYPFMDDRETVVLKHVSNKKWFAIIMKVKSNLYLNVKTDPEYSELLRSAYDYIIPAYHMNKEHWNTIILNDKCDKELIEELLNQSYDLTNRKQKRNKSI